MKKSIFILMAVVLGMTACNEAEITSVHCTEISMDENFGESHNAICEDFILQTKTNILSTSNFNMRKKILADYFITNHRYDVTPVFESYDYYFKHSDYQKELGNSKVDYDITLFDPVDFMLLQEANLPPSAYKLIIEVLKLTKKASSLDDRLRIINDYKEKTLNLSELEECEKNALWNQLDVYESSTVLWFNFNFTSKSKFDAKEDSWKVASADMVQGFFGGLMGGPIGAAAGIASGSATMLIGLW